MVTKYEPQSKYQTYILYCPDDGYVSAIYDTNLNYTDFVYSAISFDDVYEAQAIAGYLSNQYNVTPEVVSFSIDLAII